MKKRPASKVVSFRVESKLAARLNRKAVEQRLSLNQYVKEIFIDALVQQDLRDDLMDIHHEVQDLGGDIHSLRQDISVLISKLLIELANWNDDEAKSWIDYHFLETDGEEEFEE